MYQRPKFCESEEDLLKLQEEFMKNKQQNDFKLATTLVSTQIDPSKPLSLPENAINSEVKSCNNDIKERLENTFEDIPKNFKIGRIIEKKVSESKSSFQLSKTGFPQAKRRDIVVSSGMGSIFSQQMKKLKSENNTSSAAMDVDADELQLTERVKLELIPSSSVNPPLDLNCMTLMTKVKDEIDKENLDRIGKMSTEEIMEERERLMSTMDPAIIAFLKCKRHYNQSKVETCQPSIAEQNKPEKADITIEEIASTQEVLNKPNSDKWINFDLLESNKLVWMKDISKPVAPKDEKYEARFDFDGWLLPFTQEEINDENRILYHHGEEPGRPGYTLQELFQLCRSNVIQQKIIALNTIAAILNLHSSGIYDHVIELPIEQIFFVLRFCLDENTPSTLGSSLKATRNLFCNTIDETCLDCLLGFGLGEIQPVFSVDEDGDDNTINDQQLAEQNLVKCLFRSGILIRLRYVFNVVKPTDIETIANSLDILIRLARDSDFIVKELIKFDGLIECTIKNFLPQITTTVQSPSAYNTPMIQAVKLMRVLASRNDKIASKFVSEYNVLDSISTYLSNENLSKNTTGLKLQIESLQLLETLTFYGLTMEYLKVMRPVILRLLDYHVKSTNVDSSWTMQTHIAAILNLLSQMARQDYHSVLEYVKILFEYGMPKWMTQFVHLSTYSCGKLQIISSLLGLLTNVCKYQSTNLHLVWESVYKLVGKIISSDAFQMITAKLKSSSNILHNYEVHKSSSNLKFSEACAWNTADHIIPVLQTESCIPFLNKMANFIGISNSANLKLQFLQHNNVGIYLNCIQASCNFYLTSNWYTKMEADMIVNLLKIAVDCQKQLDTAIYYEVAVKSLCVFTSEMKASIEFLFINIIFCRTFYSSEVLLRDLNIDDENRLKTALEDIVNIQKVYSNVLGLQRDLAGFSKVRTLQVSQGNIMPLDWIYSPIIALYSNNNAPSKVSERAQNFVISNCLRWIYIYETYFPDLANMINPTDKFCRLACTYLGSDTLFLLPEVQILLKTCLLQILSKHEAELDFDKAIHGLKSFQDLYIQLLEQYQGVSYGDKLFGQFLLVPLAQRHNIKFRKAVWSEYAGIVQIFNVTPEEIMVDLDKYLEPAEDDASLLRCYERIVSIGAVRKFSAFYKIATHHVNAHRTKHQTMQK